MIRPLLRGRLPARLRRALRRDEGTASVEFVILFPVFMILFVSCFESGLLMTRQVMLERAVDVSVRALRLGTATPPTFDKLKKNICNIAGIIPHCMTALRVELRPVSTATFAPLTPSPVCVDRNAPIDPLNTAEKAMITPAGENELMIVRACIVVNPMFPGTGLGMMLPKDPSGGYALVSTSAFVNEPSS